MTSPTQEVLALLHGFICDHQVSLSQYIFTANERHKAIKEFLTDFRKGSVFPIRPPSTEEMEALAQLIIELDEHLFLKLIYVFDETYKYVAKYFESRSPFPVRLTLKIVESEKLVTLLKAPESFLDHQAGSLSDNTGFDHIAKGAPHFICNDIPLEIKTGKYKNNRIDTNKAITFNPKKEGGESIVGYDLDWSACWNPVIPLGEESEISSPPETCYKSTVIVPLSLPIARLSQKFKERFKLTEPSERALFGFLCLDHVSPYFFKELEDVHFAYIIADMLSLYIIQQLQCTEYSSIYYEAKYLIAELGEEIV